MIKTLSMAKIKTKNQPNAPSKKACGMCYNKYTGKFEKKKDLRKVIFKGKDATIVLFKDIDVVNASVRINALKSLYHDWRGKFIMTR